MNVKRFTARTAREALANVRQAFGEEAVVLSTKPCAEGIEVLAMAPEGIAQIEQVAAGLAARSPGTAPSARQESHVASSQAVLAAPVATQVVPASSVAQDVGQLGMSTMSFQSYVRERMLKRREAALRDEASEALAARNHASQAVQTARPAPAVQPAPAALAAQAVDANVEVAAAAAPSFATNPMPRAPATITPALKVAEIDPALFNPMPERIGAREVPRSAAPSLAHTLPSVGLPASARAQAAPNADPAATQRDQQAMMAELRQMKGLIEDRFGALAFMDKLQRHPAHARLTQKLLDCGFSAALIRKLADHMQPAVADETEWVTSVLERNLVTGEHEPALEDQGGVYALIGATGVGKTTSTAKLAAAFAAKHGATHLGLITLDAYRVGAHEQLRAYGRILGVPVHTAHDKASLEDLLELLAGKTMVLIDTAGMAQRDVRTAELLDMLDHPSINKLLVLNCASQGETLEDVIVSYRGAQARGVVLSKMDEAVKLAPVLDAVIRHRLSVLGVANGQRVPEDWHRLPAQVLVHRALRTAAWSAFRVEADDVPLIFSAPRVQAPFSSAVAAAHA